MRLIFTLLIILFSFAVQASVPVYRNLKISAAEPELRATTVFQDRDGYIWIGSEKGLYKYDGFRFDKAFLDSLADVSAVNSITQNDSGVIYVGMSDGRIFRKLKSWELFPSPFTKPVSSIIFHSTGIWVATYGEGISCFTDDWQKLKTKDPSVYKMILHPSGKIFAGTDLGLVIIETQNRRVHELDQQNGLPDNIVRSVTAFGDTAVLIGTEEKGICSYNINNGNFSVPAGLTDWGWGPVNCFARLANEFWIGTAGKGIVDYEYRGERRIRRFSRDNGFPFSNINDMIHDRHGNIWIIADNKLLLSPGEKTEFINEAGAYRLKNVSAVSTDDKGYVWISTGSNLYRYNSIDNSAKQFLTDKRYQNLHITTHASSAAGLWIGTFDNGLLLLDTANGSVKWFDIKDGLPNANVISIDVSGDSVWLATLGGIALVTRAADNQFKFTDFTKAGAGRGFVYCIYNDHRGGIWFGTDGNGLLVYEKGNFRKIEVPGKSAKVIYSVTGDRYGNIWFSTQQDGVYRYNGKSLSIVNTASGLRDTEIAGLSLDIGGNVLVVHNKGIDLIDPVKLSIHPIGVDAGMESIEPALNAISNDRFGSVWIGTVMGLIRFYNYDKPDSYDPIVHIRRVFSLRNPASTSKDTVFDYDENQVSVEYTGLWYGNPESVTYQYRLIGYNSNWITTSDRMVTFPNLPAGKYTFEVKATRSNNFRYAPSDKIVFVVKSPLWKKPWFIILSLLVIVMIVYLIVRGRTQRLRRMDRLEKERITYQYDTLRSQINPHFLFNSFNTLIGIIEDNQEQAAEFAGKLSDYFRHMVQYRDKEVITLGQELELVRTYAYLQQQRFGDNLIIRISVPAEWLQQYGVPPLSLQLLIENAVKHNAVSHETPLIITVTGSGREFLIISNNLNPKSNPDRSTGIGLENIIHRFRIVSEHKVEVRKSSTHFEVELPLIKLAAHERTDR